MARVLVCEHSPAVAELFALVLLRAGHEPIAFDAGDPAAAHDVDAILLEPATPGALEHVRAARRRRPGLAVVCASIYPRSEEVAALRPAAYLVKPVPLAELEDALAAALAAQP